MPTFDYKWQKSDIRVRIQKNFQEGQSATIFLSEKDVESSAGLRKFERLANTLDSANIASSLDVIDGQPVLRLVGFKNAPQLISLLASENIVPGESPTKEKIQEGPPRRWQGFKDFVARYAMNINAALFYLGHAFSYMRGTRERQLIEAIHDECDGKSAQDHSAIETLSARIAQDETKSANLERILKDYGDDGITTNSQTLLRLVDLGMDAHELGSMMQGGNRSILMSQINAVTLSFRLLFGAGDKKLGLENDVMALRQQLSETGATIAPSQLKGPDEIKTRLGALDTMDKLVRENTNLLTEGAGLYVALQQIRRGIRIGPKKGDDGEATPKENEGNKQKNKLFEIVEPVGSRPPPAYHG